MPGGREQAPLPPPGQRRAKGGALPLSAAPRLASCPSGRWWWALARRGCSPPCCWPSAASRPSSWSGARPVEQRERRRGALLEAAGCWIPTPTSSLGRGAPAPSPTASSPPAPGTSASARCWRSWWPPAPRRKSSTRPSPTSARISCRGWCAPSGGRLSPWAGEVRFSTQVTDFRLKEGRLAGPHAAHPRRRDGGYPGVLPGDSGHWPQRPGHLPGAAPPGPAHGGQGLLRGRPHRAPSSPSSTAPSTGTSPGTQPWARRTTSSPATWKTAGRRTPSACAPAGTVTGAASEEGGVVTNGMSAWARDGRNSNAGLAGGRHPGGFRRARAPWPGWLSSGRSSGRPSAWLGAIILAPAQRVADLLAGRALQRLRRGAAHLRARRGARGHRPVPARLSWWIPCGSRPAHFGPPSPGL